MANILTQNEEDSPDSDSVTDGLLEKYNLQEDPNKVYQKITQGIWPNKKFIECLVKTLAEKKVSEKDACASLQKDLGVTTEAAYDIVNTLQTTVVPHFKKVLEKRLILDKEEYQTQSPVLQKSSNTIDDPVSTPEIKSKRVPKKNIVDIGKINEPTIKKPENPRLNKADSYREPIE